MITIAEVKTHSPFGWESDESWDELFEVANEVGDAISIHTNPRWHGSFDLLSRARSLTEKPLLAKGIHETDDEIKQALDLGANYVLVVGRIPEVALAHCLVEPNTLDDLRLITRGIKAVWNSRDLPSGGLKTDTFEDAREIFPGWLCQASNIASIADVNPNADAILVGTNLRAFAESRE